MPWRQNSYAEIYAGSGGGGGPSSPSIGQLLNWIQYAPAPRVLFNPLPTSLTALDTTNITLPFTTTSSGKVKIVAKALGIDATSSSNEAPINLALLDHTSHSQIGFTIAGVYAANNLEVGVYMDAAFYLTLTANTSYQFDLAASTPAAGTGIISAAGLTGTMDSTNVGSPIVMEAYGL